MVTSVEKSIPAWPRNTIFFSSSVFPRKHESGYIFWGKAISLQGPMTKHTQNINSPSRLKKENIHLESPKEESDMKTHSFLSAVCKQRHHLSVLFQIAHVLFYPSLTHSVRSTHTNVPARLSCTSEKQSYYFHFQQIILTVLKCNAKRISQHNDAF